MRVSAPPGADASHLEPARGSWLAAQQRDGLATGFIATLLLISLVLACWSLADLIGARAVNGSIRALAAGHDVAIGADAPPRLVVARAKFLFDRDRIEEAEALAPRVSASAEAAATADFAHDLGNARLRQAFRLIEDNDITAATPLVRLAQEAYSQALRIDPARWDTKVNLDIASRLVRTFPRAAQEQQPGERPRNIWTDMPGLPRGLP